LLAWHHSAATLPKKTLATRRSFWRSDLSSATTGEVIYVDAGFRNISIKTE
jgi:enoyl-[acyl-carrier-protein] reductase (NADH)